MFDDPPGEYVMSVELSDGRRAAFTFRLRGASGDREVKPLRLGGPHGALVGLLRR